MKTSQEDKCQDKNQKTTEVRMGREVPIIKKSGCCGSEKDTECTDKKGQTREKMASSTV